MIGSFFQRNLSEFDYVIATGAQVNRVVVCILAGGQGARFWPVSRQAKPKQFLELGAGGESLIQLTARRIEPLCGQDSLFVVTNLSLADLCKQHVPKAKVICEPFGRNTAASIGLAALHARRLDPQAVMVVLPADHAVSDEKQLLATLSRAVQIAASDQVLVTIGIRPEFPHTGYGYIWRGHKCGESAFHVKRFYEKPNLERAQSYCATADYYWNSGMFVWKAEVILKAISDFMPQLYAGLLEIDKSISTGDQLRVTQSVFEALESISIDFGVLELARNCVVVEASPFGWNDVGSWDAVAAWDRDGRFFLRDQGRNLAHGEVLLLDSEDSIVLDYHAVTGGKGGGTKRQKLIALLGVRDIVVIDSGDALLICPKERVQDVKKIVEELKQRGRTDLI